MCCVAYRMEMESYVAMPRRLCKRNRSLGSERPKGLCHADTVKFMTVPKLRSSRLHEVNKATDHNLRERRTLPNEKQNKQKKRKRKKLDHETQLATAFLLLLNPNKWLCVGSQFLSFVLTKCQSLQRRTRFYNRILAYSYDKNNGKFPNKQT